MTYLIDMMAKNYDNTVYNNVKSAESLDLETLCRLSSPPLSDNNEENDIRQCSVIKIMKLIMQNDM